MTPTNTVLRLDHAGEREVLDASGYKREVHLDESECYAFFYIVDKGENRSHEARKGYAVVIDADEGLLAEPAEVGAVANVEVEAVRDDEEEGRV